MVEWANFEELRMPSSARPFGYKASDRVLIANQETLPELAGAEARSGSPKWETGKGCLSLRTYASSNPNEYITGFALGGVQDRSALGATERMLYQADFYITPGAADMPAIAVLAMEAEESAGGTTNTPRRFYRFGMTLGKEIYFSVVEDPIQPATVYLRDANLAKSIPRPGWHRFAIMLEASEVIRCFVDGHEASFSPIRDSRLAKLQVGVMLADGKRSYTAYTDNISIQRSDTDSPIPKSPYAGSWGGEGADAASQATPASTSVAVPWLGPEEAWAAAVASRAPLLLLFESPDTPGSQQMDSLIRNDMKVRQYLARHKCARVDVNQLHGGEIAQKYGIFKVCLLYTSPSPRD